MILAGAGSGKTKVLTCRIANLIVNEGVSPDSIMAITFTNKAAQEMKKRIRNMIPGYSGQWIQTFHAACYKILRMDIQHLGYDKNFVIMDDSDCKSLLKSTLKENQFYDVKAEDLLYPIKQMKNRLANPEEFFINMKLSLEMKEKYLQIYRAYSRQLKEINALDFEDLIVLCTKLFRNFPEVLEKYRNWFRYILVDEYQDTNMSQYDLIHCLAERNKNLFIVGDPDQSIYSWRGAEPHNIKRFLKDYPEARVIKLEQNYRSTGNILDAANHIINYNTGREDKHLFTDSGPGELITCFNAPDSFQEARFIAENISEALASEGCRYRDCAIFYRTHAQSRVIEEALTRRNIPYKIIGASKFYDRKEIKDILSYLRLVCNPNDILSFERIVNMSKKGVGRKTLDKIRTLAQEKALPILEVLNFTEEIAGLGQKSRATLEEFYGMLKYFTALNDGGSSLADLLDAVLETTSYKETLIKNDHLEAEARLENIHELRSLALEFEQNGGSGLEEFLAGTVLVQEADDVDDSDLVFMMTFHGAKGLEFSHVFMSGMEEGVFPSYRSESREEMEEERRLCYVGITRARKRLFLSHTVTRLLYGYERNNAPSRFLKEIPEGLLKIPAQRVYLHTPIQEGDTVLHRKFGPGNVLELREDGIIAIIDFERGGTKMMRLDMAPLEKIG
jgi:DNA helicase-2/ATP-dependent DNA helicase PcrA